MLLRKIKLHMCMKAYYLNMQYTHANVRSCLRAIVAVSVHVISSSQFHLN